MAHYAECYFKLHSFRTRYQRNLQRLNRCNKHNTTRRRHCSDEIRILRIVKFLTTKINSDSNNISNIPLSINLTTMCF